MKIKAKRRLFLVGAVPAFIMTTGCDFTSGITFHNQTSRPITPYPFRLTPPPPHREADPANTVPASGSAPLDPNGFNPVFYVSAVDDVARANGIFIGFDFVGENPHYVQYKVFHYKVPPGQAGTDPDNQPILFQNEIVEVENVDLSISVRVDPDAPGRLAVTVEPE